MIVRKNGTRARPKENVANYSLLVFDKLRTRRASQADFPRLFFATKTRIPFHYSVSDFQGRMLATNPAKTPFFLCFR